MEIKQKQNQIFFVSAWNLIQNTVFYFDWMIIFQKSI